MKNQIKLLTFALIVMTLAGCASIYYAPDADALARRDRHIAVVPPVVSIAASKKIDAASIQEQQRTESVNFQKEMYRWLLRRKMQNAINVEIQDVETTNARLNKSAAYLDGTLEPAQICELLEVDAILTSNYSLSKPMSEGGAIALGVLVGFWGNTNETVATLELHDQRTQKLFWSYHHKLSGSVGSSPAQLVDNLMRRASKKMPYAVK
ncbi:MAG: hypothetical protein KDC57_21760 [Saprospiraceae bacterium]|nr:hypothetical protein [Saprospiraceae bacterium]